ncbi:hypothetical protein OE88DRAFT_1727747 [Heliocybe sulcata]|uniref:Uncharacterized protein n=1 Tax=Heliocybe sulcata TaxID=5364 RepID=A0A5C3MU49_9AGAM|nr:hypothetical protein OE88DRAFT_1727747 [Heliocybe sulcata]
MASTFPDTGSDGETRTCTYLKRGWKAHLAATLKRSRTQIRSSGGLSLGGELPRSIDTLDEYLTAGTAKINVTDGDDHVWVRAGDSKAGRVGNEWRILIADVAAAVLGKRKEGSSSGQPSLVVRDPEDESWARRASAVELDLDSDDEQDVQHDLTRLAELTDMLSEAADIIRSQIPHKNRITEFNGVSPEVVAI